MRPAESSRRGEAYEELPDWQLMSLEATYRHYYDVSAARGLSEGEFYWQSALLRVQAVLQARTGPIGGATSSVRKEE